MRTRDLNFNKVLESAHANGEAKDFRHLDGWRDIRKVTAKGLYRDGKIGVALAIQHGAKMSDHLAAIDSGKVNINDLINAGVDLHRLESYRKQQLTRSEHKVNGTVKTENVVASCIIRNGQVSRTVESKAARQPTAQEIEVAIAVAQAQAREKARKVAAKVREKGITVKLSAEEQAALIARLNGKGQQVIK